MTLKNSYPNSDAAKLDLFRLGFVRYISPVNGEELFSKPSNADDVYGGYKKTALARIKHHWVSPTWGDERNFFTVEFI